MKKLFASALMTAVVVPTLMLAAQDKMSSDTTSTTATTKKTHKKHKKSTDMTSSTTSTSK